jgi:hypothetical protein
VPKGKKIVIPRMGEPSLRGEPDEGSAVAGKSRCRSVVIFIMATLGRLA